MPRPRVFVTRAIPEAGLRILRGACATEVWEDELPPDQQTLTERARDCEGLLSMLSDRIDADLIAACPRLRVVSNYAVGYENVDVEAATDRGVLVGNTPGVLTDATADLALALLLAAARQVVDANRYAVSGDWKTWRPRGHRGQDLTGRTLGIVGMGRIGLAVARRCHGGWGMRVLYHDRQVGQTAERELDARRVDLETLLAESDFVSLHTDLNAETRGLFDREAFRRMKSTAVLVNTARGAVVRQDDLVEALRTGEIFAAGLDVTDPEPPAADDPLLSLPNVVLLPHIGSATFEVRDRMAEIAAENLLAGLEGRPLPHCVNAESLAEGS
jgi:glyoxylate reductase